MARRRAAMLALITVLATGAGALPAGAAGRSGAAPATPLRWERSPGWSMGGHDLANSRSNPTERSINRFTARRLTVKWKASMHGDTSATPAVVGGAVYIPDLAGYFSKLDAATGRVIWSHQVSEYDGVAGAISRTSPAVSHGIAYIGDLGGMLGAGARLMAIDTRTGALVWSTLVDSHPLAQLTQSPVVSGGVVYQGVSSGEETAASLVPGYPCCTFRGSLAAVDAATGRIRWKTYMVPDNGGATGGYSGVAVWGSTPAIDPAHHRVYVTTGNNYTVPKSAEDCQTAGGTPSQCLAPDDRINSILALDTRTGAVVGRAGPERFDAWTLGCLPGFPPNNCPANAGPDWDFGDGAHLFTIRSHGRLRQVVGAGEKSGEYWAVDAATGQILWSTAAGPGGTRGGILLGTATDGRRIYLAESDSAGVPYQLPDGRTISAGSFVALDPATGRILWQTPDPSGGVDTGAVTTAGGVVYAGSMSGHMYALDAATGKVLWDYLGPGASNAGPAVAGGTVYWGNGYPRYPPPEPIVEHYFYAFSPRH
jgi:polyvinyl alcohol dehydrogenase (cytochrome)